MLEEQIVLSSLLIPNVSKVADCVTYLHTGYIAHWCICNISNMQT